jgi:hypothetical protein
MHWREHRLPPPQRARLRRQLTWHLRVDWLPERINCLIFNPYFSRQPPRLSMPGNRNSGLIQKQQAPEPDSTIKLEIFLQNDVFDFRNCSFPSGAP